MDAQSSAGAGRTQGCVVFSVVRDAACDECGEALGRGRLLRKEGERALCLACADLDHLVYLPAGDAALTRRAAQHSRLRAVVVRWSGARKRYERQGVLVEEEALARAEAECLADTAAREARRRREALRRDALDREYVEAVARAIRARYPRCPTGEEVRIAEHACRRRSGRVGRSAAARRLEAQVLDLAAVAHVRHRLTRYDELLARGHDRETARAAVCEEVEHVLRRWSGSDGGRWARTRRGTPSSRWRSRAAGTSRRSRSTAGRAPR